MGVGPAILFKQYLKIYKMSMEKYHINPSAVQNSIKIVYVFKHVTSFLFQLKISDQEPMDGCILEIL